MFSNEYKIYSIGSFLYSIVATKRQAGTKKLRKRKKLPRKVTGYSTRSKK